MIGIDLKDLSIELLRLSQLAFLMVVHGKRTQFGSGGHIICVRVAQWDRLLMLSLVPCLCDGVLKELFQFSDASGVLKECVVGGEYLLFIAARYSGSVPSLTVRCTYSAGVDVTRSIMPICL